MGVTDSVRAAARELPLVPDEDEFDPFAGESLDTPPADEGDDRAHEDDSEEAGGSDG
jgi:hypothetical protein